MNDLYGNHAHDNSEQCEDEAPETPVTFNFPLILIWQQSYQYSANRDRLTARSKFERLKNPSMNRHAMGVVVIWASFFYGCGADTPLAWQAREVFDTAYETVTNLGAKVVDFKKQNAEMKESSGDEYHFLVAADLPAGLV